MAQISEILPPARQWQLAILARTPAQLARTFAAFAGQFANRSEFDALAREVSDLYDVEGSSRFRRQLDRRLCDRYHDPVAWDVTPDARDRPS
ncbi:hypothetical protein [Nitrolancea hollandica]|uniref:Uncharacterized protein n=1 Tax=Nitrolancea hollandica Lb TaxID=1129897 RepID=I4EL79_9BACT|nr:hypothetical protein [Nitrolancea hollandica]CCF85441.1 hypothetical protein NITHO_4990006 [Nitrolancea hollandica Lb]